MNSLSVVDEYLKSKSIDSIKCESAKMIVNGEKRTVISLYPKPVAYKIKSTSGYYTECYPTIFEILPIDIDSASKQLNYDLFKKSPNCHFKTSPSKSQSLEILLIEWKKFVEMIPNLERLALINFHRLRWSIFQLIHGNNYGTDLSISNPALCYFTAQDLKHNNYISELQRIYNSEGDKIFGLKQKTIVTLLGLPGDESTVKILRKIDATTLRRQSRQKLELILSNPKRKDLLRHLQEITGCIIDLVSNRDFFPYLTQRLIYEISNLSLESDRYSVYFLLSDTIEMLESIKNNPNGIKFFSIKAIQTVHDELMYSLNIAEHDELMKLKFPEPPLKGNLKIIPLVTPKQVIEEAIAQHNCVVSYIRNIAAGKSYLYKVIEPERATLSIHKQSTTWTIGQLLVGYNQEPDYATCKAVFAWFK